MGRFNNELDKRWPPYGVIIATSLIYVSLVLSILIYQFSSDPSGFLFQGGTHFTAFLPILFSDVFINSNQLCSYTKCFIMNWTQSAEIQGLTYLLYRIGLVIFCPSLIEMSKFQWKLKRTYFDLKYIPNFFLNQFSTNICECFG